jgi:HK97 family phage major capsid protein
MNKHLSPAKPQFRLAPTSGAAIGANDETRRITFVLSDESVGRDNHVIYADAWKLENFKRNPVMPWAHDPEQPPVGKFVAIGTENRRLIGTVEFADFTTYPFADTIFRLYKAGFLNAVSTGWIPLAWTAANDRSRPGGLNFTSCELLEVSGVPVPSLPTALATARGYFNVEPLAEWAGKALERGGSPQIGKDMLMQIRSAAGAPKLVSGAPDYDAIARRERAAALAAGRQSPFASFGAFLQTVARSSMPAEMPDARLVRAPTGAGEVDPTGGGFMVPREYLDGLIGSLWEEAVLAPLCDRRETSRPQDAMLPAIDETSRATGSRWGGVTSYWKNEGDQATPSFPKFRNLQFAANKLLAFCVVTNELLADVPLLGTHIRRAFAAEMASQVDDAILTGTGAGTPKGIVGAGATITVAKETCQASNTITAGNISAMWSRLPVPCRRRAVWIVNGDAEGQLELLGTGGASPGSAAMYFPQGQGGNEFPLLKGRPVLYGESCPALGTPGDIILADLSQYLLVSSSLDGALSVHCRWNTDEAVYRFRLRIDGQPNLGAPITPANGGNTVSPFVVLAQR